MTRAEDHLDHLVATLGNEIGAAIEGALSPLGQFANGLAVKGARPIQLSRVTATNPGLWSAEGRLMGWSVRAGADAPGSLTLFDSRTGDGDVLGVVTIPAGTTATHWLGTGVSFGEALSAVVAGLTGVVYVRD